MADITTGFGRVVTDINALTREGWSDVVQATISDAMPMVQVFLSRYGDKKNPFFGLGVPGSEHILSGIPGIKGRKQEVLSRRYQPLVQTALAPAGDSKMMRRYDNMPTRTGWESNGPATGYQRPSVGYVEMVSPCNVPNSDIRDCKRANKFNPDGWSAIGDMFKSERNRVLPVHMMQWNKMHWGTLTAGEAPAGAGTSGYPDDETQDNWNALYSFKAIANYATHNVYCGVDRSLSTGLHMRGQYISGASRVFRDMIRYVMHEIPITNADGSTSKGFYSKGADLPVIFTDGESFNIALAEAEGMKGAKVIAGGEEIPEIAKFGFKRGAVQIDNTYIIPDPACPANTAVGLNLAAWTVSIHPDGNFFQSDPVDMAKLGMGDYHYWWMKTRILEVCEAPQLGIVYWDSLV